MKELKRSKGFQSKEKVKALAKKMMKARMPIEDIDKYFGKRISKYKPD